MMPSPSMVMWMCSPMCGIETEGKETVLIIGPGLEISIPYNARCWYESFSLKRSQAVTTLNDDSSGEGWSGSSPGKRLRNL